MKKKWAAVALAMTMCVGLLTGCVSVNRDKDKAQIVAKVGDETLTKEQLYSQMQSYLSAYGVEDDLWDEGLDSQLREYMDEQGVTLAQSWMELRVAAAICDRDMPLTEEEMIALATFMGTPQEKVNFAEGDLISVITGAWQGTEAVIRSVDAEKQTATIFIDMFGHETPVELNFTDIKKVQ